MKRCSNCGMINPDTAARCKQCGSVLQPPGIRCPKCGTVNPATQTECSRCHTRLPAPDQRPRPGAPQGAEKIAPSAVKGFSVPEKPPAEPVQAVDADLPDWLRSLMGDSPSTEQPAQATAPQSAPRPSVQRDTEPLPGRGQAAAASTPPAQEELPDWLAKLMGDQPPAAEAAADQEAPSSDDLPTWLQQSETPDSETAADSGAAVDEAWMARLLGMEGPAPEPSDEGVPAVASAPRATPEEESPEPAAELPDWLTAITPEAGETAEPSAWVADAAPMEPTAAQDDQVSENRSPEEAEPEGPAESTPASALNADGISSSAEGGEAGSDAEAFDGIAIPNWQAGAGDGEKAPDSHTEDDAPEPEGLLPDWMREADPSAEMPEHPLEPAGETETMPAVEDEEPSAPKATGEPGLELPSWMNELLGENPEPLPSTVTEPELTPTEELPTELPDWLANLSPEPAKAPVFSGSEGELGPETGPDQAGPGWLKDVTPPPGTLSVRASTPALIGGEGEPPEPPVSEPALADVAAQEAAAPDWLAELTQPSPETPAEEAPIPAPAEAEELTRAEVPAWLQGLRPPGSAPLPTPTQDEQPAPAASQRIPGELVEAEIPEWLQALRPQVGTGGERLIEAAARLEAPEELGPLAGIAGLLPALAVMDLPAEHKPTLGHAIPDSVYQQAQLWQDLLTHPRGVEQPVIRAPQRHRVAPIALRLVLVLLLAVAALAGFLLLPQGQPLSQVPSPTARPWINDLYQIVEGLPAGEKVLVAVEYGPAEAIELGTVAQGILEHLNARQADVTLVSSLPEGVALIPGLLDVVSMTNSTLLDRPTYVVGEASGVARVLAQAKDEAVTRVIVISSRLDRLQWWIEQSTVTKLPVSVGTAASMGPWVRAYLETEQTQGGIIGYAEVQAYRELRHAETPGSDRVLDVLMLTHWVALGFLALGFLYYLVAGKKGSG